MQYNRIRSFDKAALRDIWQAGFADGTENIDRFLTWFGDKAGCVLADEDGRPVGAMMVLPGPDVRLLRREQLNTAYVYALSVLPASRSKGLGKELYRACVDAALREGADAVCVLPAEEGLYPFYTDARENVVLTRAREARFARADFAGIDGGLCARIDYYRYGGIRESVLSGEPHAVMTDEYLEWEAELHEQYGGGFFVSESGCAVTEGDGKQCLVSELLVPNGDPMKLLAAVASFHPAEEYIVRSPLFMQGPGVERDFMLAALRPDLKAYLPDDIWWGPAYE